MAEKEGEVRVEEVTMVEVRVFKLVAGDSAMKEGEASGLEDDGLKEELRGRRRASECLVKVRLSYQKGQFDVLDTILDMFKIVSHVRLMK